MSNELKAAYAAAKQKVGAPLVETLANTFGATNGRAEDVPEDKHASFAVALRRLVRGEAIPMAMAARAAHGDPAPKSERHPGEEVFAGIRADAYGDDDDKPAATLDSVAIFQRWNAARRKQD